MKSDRIGLRLFPLENLSGVEGDERLARGFVQDLSSELTRFPALEVTLSDGKATEAPGAGYLLKGSLRRSRENVRISVQLATATDGRHVWAGRFDEADVLSIQDEIVAKVANALSISLDHSLLVASRRRHPTKLAAYECWLRGMECLQRGAVAADEEAREFFSQALEVEPHYARAYAGISLSHFNDWSCQAWALFEEKEQLAYDNAVRAEALDPNDAAVQLILARVEQYRREFGRALPRMERGEQLAPNDARTLIQLAGCWSYHGDPERSLALGERALALDPLCPGWFYGYAALPFFSLRRYEEALAVAEKAPPGQVVDVPAFKAAICAYLGEREMAARYLAEFRADFDLRIAGGAEPGGDELFRWVLHLNPYRRQEDVDHLGEGLRLAGLPGSSRRTMTGAPLNWPVANTFRREGALWTLAFDHEVVQVSNLRGLNDLARLLATPGLDVPCVDLADAKVAERGIERVDAAALVAYRSRLREIEADANDAEKSADLGRSAKLAEEHAGILREIQAATGLGQRVRRTGGAHEKARTSVTWRIRAAIKRIGTAHPGLGRHLQNSIRTGAACSYQPEQPTDWRL
ncbi:MAG: hypothetical protein WA771_01190 [Chthoniobacterales bacterium]